MRRSLKEFVLAIGAVGLGVILFAVASSHVYARGWLSESWGYPLPWHEVGDLVIATPLPFGIQAGEVVLLNLLADLAVSFAIPIATVELSAHVAIPYFERALKIRREKRRTTATAAFGFVEAPQ